MKVEFYKHNVEAEDIERVRKVLEGPFLSTGAVVEEFEQKLAKYLGVKHVVGVSSCTAALHLALAYYSQVWRGTVLTTPMTFVATSNVILYTENRIRFHDVRKEDGTLDYISDEELYKVKAVIPVHLYGQMCQGMGSLHYRAQEVGAAVIADAAHALELKGVCSACDAVCFSFYPTKSITSGEGGAVATNSSELADFCKQARLHGMSKSAWKRYEKKYEHWDMEVLGWKYNMTNIQAALLLGQLDRVEQYRDRRKQIWEYYKQELQNCVGTMEQSGDGAFLMFTVLVEDRDKVLGELQERGIGVAVNFRPVHLLKYYQRFGFKEGDFPNAEYIGARTITLPLYPKLTDAEAEYVVQSVKEVVGVPCRT